MKPLQTITLLMAANVAVSSYTVPRDATVYVCTGKSARCYHVDRSCKGLNQCKGLIKSVTLAEARKMKRGKPCGWCCK